jgi:hypothetical protein
MQDNEDDIKDHDNNCEPGDRGCNMMKLKNINHQLKKDRPTITIDPLSKDIPLFPGGLVPQALPPSMRTCPTSPSIGSGYLNPLYNPFDPDYQAITVSAGDSIGGTGVVTWDRYGNIYLGLGVNAGESLTAVSGSYTRGWIGDPLDDDYPSPNNSESFLTGVAVNVSGGAIGGGGLTYSPGSNTQKIAYETGVYSPQMGVSVVYSGLIYDAK